MPSFYSTPLHDRFVPVPVRARADGWTVPRQRGFVAGLMAGRSPGDAAREQGMRLRSAQRLRERPGARSFAKAWDTAANLSMPVPRAEHPHRRVKLYRYRGRVVHSEIVPRVGLMMRSLARRWHDEARGGPICISYRRTWKEGASSVTSASFEEVAETARLEAAERLRAAPPAPEPEPEPESTGPPVPPSRGPMTPTEIDDWISQRSDLTRGSLGVPSARSWRAPPSTQRPWAPSWSVLSRRPSARIVRPPEER